MDYFTLSSFPHHQPTAISPSPLLHTTHHPTTTTYLPTVISPSPLFHTTHHPPPPTFPLSFHPLLFSTPPTTPHHLPSHYHHLTTSTTSPSPPTQPPKPFRTFAPWPERPGRTFEIMKKFQRLSIGGCVRRDVKMVVCDVTAKMVVVVCDLTA
uniref:Uncharacterized protein n=1 Tax=Beta vulgaris TaxID=161934 RepID=E2DMZ8_BETVU|nr:hypothetical protein [Beta vulgaris]